MPEFSTFVLGLLCFCDDWVRVGNKLEKGLFLVESRKIKKNEPWHQNRNLCLYYYYCFRKDECAFRFGFPLMLDKSDQNL